MPITRFFPNPSPPDWSNRNVDSRVMKSAYAISKIPRFIGIVRIVRAFLTRLAIKCDISGHYCSLARISSVARGSLARRERSHAEAGDSAVTRGMDSARGIMISSDAHSYVRSPGARVYVAIRSEPAEAGGWGLLEGAGAQGKRGRALLTRV